MGRYCARIQLRMTALHITALQEMAVLRLAGPDVIRFLQGQLSQDVTRLAQSTSLFAGLHNSQGRCLALLRLFALDQQLVLATVPTSLAAAVRTQLGKFILRSKLTIEDASSQWQCYGLAGVDAAAAASTRLHFAMDGSGMRQLVVAARGETLPEAERAPPIEWQLDNIEAGIPELCPATSGSFIAQMLNLDLLDGISFTKGCYTGQEIIARSHYLGQVKRRMQRFRTSRRAPLAPGERVTLADGRSAQIVSAAPEGDSGQQFLAVAPLQIGQAAEPGDTTQATLDSLSEPLPYTS
jgi:tRNA-modifying protein YgfZ